LFRGIRTGDYRPKVDVIISMNKIIVIELAIERMFMIDLKKVRCPVNSSNSFRYYA
jgi:hypothetical protein